MFDTASAYQSFAEDGTDLAPGPPANAVGFFIEDDAIKGIAEQFALTDHIAVAAVTCGRVDGRAKFVRQRPQRFQERSKRGRVMAIIQNDSSAVEFKEIEAPWRMFEVGNERFQAGKDDFARHSQYPNSGGGGQGVFDLESNVAAVRQWHSFQADQRDLVWSLSVD